MDTSDDFVDDSFVDNSVQKSTTRNTLDSKSINFGYGSSIQAPSEDFNGSSLDESMVVRPNHRKPTAIIDSSDEEEDTSVSLSSSESDVQPTSDYVSTDTSNRISRSSNRNSNSYHSNHGDSNLSISNEKSTLSISQKNALHANIYDSNNDENVAAKSVNELGDSKNSIAEKSVIDNSSDVNDIHTNKATVRKEHLNERTDGDESIFVIPCMRNKQIIDSDTESDYESSHEESNERSNESIPKTVETTSTSRLSDNFRNLKSEFCSTMINNFQTVDKSESDDVIDVSDDETYETADDLPKPPPTPKIRLLKEKNRDPRQVVSKVLYEDQAKTVKKLEYELAQVSNIFRTLDINKLPDKGRLLQQRYNSIESSLKLAKSKLMDMVPSTDEVPSVPQKKPITWEDIKVESDIVQPKTLGQRALQTYNAQKSVTMERLQQLHGSLSSCPTPDTLAEDPKGLKVELMAHQKHAVAWLTWREQQQPSGGILADDMGLGKTLTMLSLMLKSLEEAPDRDKENEWKRREKDFVQGGTLIICPASLVKQWEAEVHKHCKRGLINIDCYHGPKREPKAKYLAKYDMVITTYTICQTELEKTTALNQINWRRIILDEGHQIRNHKSRTSIAVCKLEAKSRWVLTGTPIQNKELDMYALMKFLHCTPFDDYHVWKTWIANKDTGGYQRLQTVVSSLMLRRTKAQLQATGALQNLPERSWKVVNVTLTEDEMVIYEKVLMFSRTIFAQYLHQRSNKGNLNDFNGRPTVTKAVDPNSPYYKIYEKVARRCKEVKQHEILMVLLRLRQCCCHPTLITQMLEKAEFEEDDDTGVTNLMEELQKLDLADNDEKNPKKVEVADTKKFNIENPLFSPVYQSQKIVTILETVRDIIHVKQDKVIIVSQWTSFLRLIGNHLKEEDINFVQLDGTLKIDARMEILKNINNSSHPTKVLLLSLTAGGVGLNLVGANHLLLVDIHWNPQLEIQAQDRIYRVGQKKPVNIYKFVTLNTIEEAVKQIQDHKTAIADAMLTGAKIDHSKLSLQDLRTLFNM